MRIIDVINKTTPFFEKNGIKSPRLNIELLLAHLLKKKRLDLYLSFNTELSQDVLAQLRFMVMRRAQGEPIQYILGVSEFYGLELDVDSRVLIPRPETEILVQAVINKQKTSSLQSSLRILDLCTGSGCVAIALAKQFPHATIIASDISSDALAVAQSNAKRHKVEKNIRFIEADLLDVFSDKLAVHWIVTNPPYIASGDLVSLPKEVKDFEPMRALAAGEDGLEIIRRLVLCARRVLSPGCFLAMEIGSDQRLAVEKILSDQNFEIAEIIKDFQKHDRVVIAHLSRRSGQIN